MLATPTGVIPLVVEARFSAFDNNLFVVWTLNNKNEARDASVGTSPSHGSATPLKTAETSSAKVVAGSCCSGHEDPKFSRSAITELL